MVEECATCNRTFKTQAACIQHCKDKAHTYLRPRPQPVPPTTTAPQTSTVPKPSAAPKPPTVPKPVTVSKPVTPQPTISTAKAPALTAQPPTSMANGKAKESGLLTPAFECKPCCLLFSTQAESDAHQANVHTPKPARMYNCGPCDMEFSSAEALSIHLRYYSVHPKCPHCSSAFIDQTQLDTHVKLTHRNTFLCSPCGREVVLVEQQKHFRDSTNHPKCVVCSDGFLDDAALHQHLTSAHLESRCVPCKRQFRTVEDLQQHYLTSPMHPHCAACQIGFTDDTACNSHMEDKHPRPPVRAASPSPSSVATFSVPPPSSSLVTQRSVQSSPLTHRPSLSSVSRPTVTIITAERSELDDDTYETVEASSHVQRAISEPTLPTASSIGKGSMQDGPLYDSRSPTISERSYEEMARQRSVMRHADSESTASLRSVSSSSTRSYLRVRSPSVEPQLQPAPLRHATIETASTRPASILGQVDAEATEQRKSSVASLSARASPQISRAPSRLRETPSASSIPLSSISRPLTPSGTRTPIRTTASRPLSRVSVLSASSHAAATSSQKPSMTAVDPPSFSDSEGTIEAPTRGPKLKGVVRPQPGKTGAVSWHCRSCMQEPCVAPTATLCGHIFCATCILQELSKTGACPACGKLILLRLHVESD
ncbi:hypothetical protein C8Q73DRAFT_812230 [Cubamyces lactineus]|nr:hypothetical protein C8Q73DRAFT_812230 [Cubamyces lactineus]